jgi:hypothetical protein
MAETTAETVTSVFTRSLLFRAYTSSLSAREPGTGAHARMKGGSRRAHSLALLQAKE